MNKRPKLGDIYEIKLQNGSKAYGRLFKEYTLAIYRGTYDYVDELPDNADYFRFFGVYKNLLTDGIWKVVENRPFKHEDDAWPPPMCAVDALTGKGSIYHKGEIKECTYDECKDLEIVAAWDRNHLEETLSGETKWDKCMKKPTK